MRKLVFKTLIAGALTATVVACGAENAIAPLKSNISAACPGIDLGPAPASMALPVSAPAAMAILGSGLDTTRYQAEIAVRGNTAYTTTWNVRNGIPGNKINIWDVSRPSPVLVDSSIITGVITTGDVAVSDDGKLLVVATEYLGGSIAVYDLTDPRNPQLLSRFSNDLTKPGVHTAEIGRVNGILYAFLAVDPSGPIPARMVIVDLSNPSAPQQVYTKVTGNPFVHDSFLRDGLLFVALWNDGLEIWDVGGCGTGASPSNPTVLGSVKTLNGEVHNVWWYHDPNGSKRYAFVGEEGAGTVGSTSRGDIHIVDLSDLTQPKEVAFYHVDGAGTHNFSVDETNGVLYAAYYNAGVRALDVRGDLSSCPVSQQVTNASPLVTRCDIRQMGRELATGLANAGKPVYVWGVQYVGGVLYASDMLNGIWKMGAAK